MLKATAPTPQSPINNTKPVDPLVVLVTANATTKFASGVPLSYRFEIYNQGGARIFQSNAIPQGSGGATSIDVSSVDMEADRPYQWQVRAEYLGLAGPWSGRATFIAPENSGYIRGNEVYDPLTRSRTVGEIIGDVQFVPNVGAHIMWHTSQIKYSIPTLTGGEFSLLVTNLAFNTKGDKTKIMSMGAGDHDMTTNPRRFTIEKRGDPPGIIAWRVITSDDQIDTIGNERVVYPFQTDQTYFWKATWGGNSFNLLVREGGANGTIIYDFGKPYAGIYDPTPHFAYVGAPPGRAGEPSGSVNDMIVRQVWLSSRPRPAFANR
ncbi:MAG TPA: hypothetical protein VK886_08565 [Vicinamibacterales bacterium]|nr:hypothetical protein [Vicinamibacterales bacterium]